MAKQAETTEPMSAKTYRFKPDAQGRARNSVTHPTLGIEITSKHLTERFVENLKKEDKFKNITFVQTNIESV